MVVIHDDNECRGCWKLGVVEKLFPGRWTGPKCKGQSYKKWEIQSVGRPIQRLHPLEVNCYEDKKGTPDTRTSTGVVTPERSVESLIL